MGANDDDDKDGPKKKISLGRVRGNSFLDIQRFVCKKALLFQDMAAYAREKNLAFGAGIGALYEGKEFKIITNIQEANGIYYPTHFYKDPTKQIMTSLFAGSEVLSQTVILLDNPPLGGAKIYLVLREFIPDGAFDRIRLGGYLEEREAKLEEWLEKFQNM